MKYTSKLNYDDNYIADTIITEKNMNDKKLIGMWQCGSSDKYISDEKLRKKIITIVKNITNKEKITSDDISYYLQNDMIYMIDDTVNEIIDEFANEMFDKMIEKSIMQDYQKIK